MHSIRPDRERQLDVVVDDERDVVRASKLHKLARLLMAGFLRNHFVAVLKKRYSAFQGATHLLDPLSAIDAVGRDRIQAAQLHRSKNRLGMDCPAPGANPAPSACQVNSSAPRTASA